MEICRHIMSKEQLMSWGHTSIGEDHGKIGGSFSCSACPDVPFSTTSQYCHDFQNRDGHHHADPHNNITAAADLNDDDDDEEDMEMKAECSMCGHLGLPHYLFKCLSCSCRFQHIYCSSLYPYRKVAAICNWCLPLKLEIAGAEDDGNDNKLNSLNSNNDTSSSPVKPDQRRPHSYQQVKQIKKHSKAFEYLLQIIAELADQRCHQLTDAGDNHQTNCSHEINNGYETSKVCSFYELGHDHISEKRGSSDIEKLVHQNIMVKVENHESKNARRGETQSSKGALSAAALKRPRSHNDSCQPTEATDVGNYDHQRIKTSSQDQIKISYDQLESRRTCSDLKVGYDQDLLLQSNNLMIDYGKGAAAIVAKRPRSTKKQSMGVSYEDCMSNHEANEQGISMLDLQAEDDANVGFNLNCVNKQAGVFIQSEQTSPISDQWAAVPQLKPAAAASNKSRDHLIVNSPSRTINRRYKLLADVLC